MAQNLLSLFVDVALKGEKQVFAGLKRLETQGQKTEDKLNNIASGMAGEAKKAEASSGRIQKTLGALERKAKDVSNQAVSLKMDLKGAGEVTMGLEAIKNRRDSLDRGKITLSTTLKGASAVIGELGTLEGVSSRIDGDKVLLTADVNGTEQSKAGLLSLQSVASRIDGDNLRMKVDVDGAPQAIGELAAINSVADKVDGRNVNLQTGSGVSALEALGSAIDGVATRMRSLQQVGAAAVIPGFVAAIGAIPAIVTPALSALYALVGAIGAGLAGAAAVGGGAITALAGSIGLIAAPIKMLLSKLADYEKGTDKIAAAQKTAASAAQSYADAQRGVADAQRGVAEATADGNAQIKAAEQTLSRARQDGARSILEAERGLAEARSSGAAGIRDAESSLAQARQDGASSIRDAEANLAEARSSGAAGIASAEQDLARARASAARSVADAERGLQEARRSASQSIASAEGNLEDARDDLASSTRSLTDAQEELNRAERDEPLNQREATLDLADARDRASDAQRDYNEAVKEYGANSEEATDAARNLERAELDLQRTEGEVAETRKNGSDELQGARDGVKSAYDEQQNSADGVRRAEQELTQSRADGARQVADAQRTLLQAQQDSAQSVADSQQALADSRTEAAAQEREALQALTDARTDAAEQTKSAEQDLAAARTEAAAQAREAQRGITDAQRESARSIADAEKGLADARTGAAKQVAEAQRAVTDAQRAASQAAAALAEAEKGVLAEIVPLTAAQKRLYDEFQRFKGIASTAFTPAMDQAARLGVQVLKLATTAMPSLGRASLATMSALTRVFGTFRTEITKPVEQSSLSRFLRTIPRFTEVAGNAFVKFSLAMLNFFAQTLPYVMRFVGALDRGATSFLNFTRSASGMAAIDGFLAYTTRKSVELWTATKNLAVGFFGLYSAMDQAGMVNQVWGGFLRLTRQFRDLTARGTESRGMVVDFFTASKPVLTALWSLVGSLVNQWFRVANAVMTMRNEAGKLVLPQALKDIQAALPIIGDMLIAAFRNFGPYIGPIIQGIAELLKYYIALNPVLIKITQGFAWLLTKFRGLSHGTKQAIASVVSLRLAFAIVGPVIAALFSPLSKVAVGLGLMAGKAGKAGVAARILGVALRFMMGPVGIVITAVAALAAGFLYLNRNSKTVQNAVNAVKTTFNNLKTVIGGLINGNTGTNAFRKAFVGLPGPVQKAVKLIVIAWRGLKTSFAQAWARIKPILTQVANGIRTGLGTAFRFLIGQGKQLVAWFKQNWPQIRTTVLAVVKAVGSVVRTVLGGAFKFAVSQAKVVVDWFQRNWPLIKRTAETVFNAVKALVTNRLKTLFTIIKTVWGAAKAFWDTNSKEILAITKSVWNIIKTTISTFIKVVLGIIKATMQAITGDWRGAWNTIKGVVRTVWEAIKSNTKSVLSILGNVIKITWNNIKAITRAAWDAVYGYIKDKVTDAKDRAVLTLKIMGQGMFDRYESMKRSAKAAFEAIKDFMVNPIENAYEGIKDWVDKILDVVNSVLKAVGLDGIELGGGTESPGGNGSSGRGSRPARVARGFRRGGIATERFHRGGVGTSTPQPKTHMWNEQMGNEAFIAEREPSRTQMPYLKAAAGWHGMDVVPRRSSVPSHRGGPDGTEENPRVHKHARGGISGLVRAFAYGGFGKEYYNSAASALDQAVMSRFPVDGSSYSGHPAGAVDFLVSSGQAQGQEKTLGDSVAGWLDSNYNALNLRALIWYARARYEGGAWQPYVDNYGGGSGDVASQMHYNHPHAESLSGSFGKLNEDQTKGFTGGGGGGGVGGAIQNLILDKFNKLWDSTVQPVADRFLKPLKDSDYVMANAAGAAGQKIPDGIKEWAINKLGLSGGSSGPGGSTQDPGQGGDNRAIGERMLKASGVPGSFSSLDSLWTKESNWDHKAQNPTSTAFGIPQFLDATWQQYGGKETEPTPQIDKGLQYIRDRYGGTDAAWQHSQANNWYADGGMTNGPQQAVLGEAGPELVLPLSSARVMQSAQTALGVDQLHEEVRGMREDMRNLRVHVRDFDSPAANKLTGAQEYTAKRVINGRDGLNATKKHQSSIDKVLDLSGRH